MSLHRLYRPQEDTTAIKAITVDHRRADQLVVDSATGKLWRFDNDSITAASSIVLVPDDVTHPDPGRWVDTTSGEAAALAAAAAAQADATTAIAAAAAAQATADAGIGAVKRTVTVGHAGLTAAATSEAINIGATLPANARILSVDMRTLTAFSGGGAGAVTVDIGSSGDVDALVDGANVFAAAVDGGPSTMPPGIRPNKMFATIGAQLTATFISDVNVADLTAGSVVIDVLYCVLA